MKFVLIQFYLVLLFLLQAQIHLPLLQLLPLQPRLQFPQTRHLIQKLVQNGLHFQIPLHPLHFRPHLHFHPHLPLHFHPPLRLPRFPLHHQLLHLRQLLLQVLLTFLLLQQQLPQQEFL